MEQSPVNNQSWSSRSVFLLAAIGVAVGLGNLWRFPFIAGENGGAAFVLVYIAVVILLGLPLIAAELAVGRWGKSSAIGTMRKAIDERGNHPFWASIGWLSILIPLLGLTYYSVVAGWALDYIVKAASGAFEGITKEGSGRLFDALQNSPKQMVFWHTCYMAALVLVVGRGLKSGLERAVKVMMPALFVILCLLVIYALLKGAALEAARFLFTPDFSKINADTVLMAMGQALYSLAIGVGALITYGAYIRDDIDIIGTAKVIALADTLVALLAGLAIFPIVFAYDLTPQEGPGLIFITLPIAFGKMTGGVTFGTLFFILLSLAAFTSSIGMLEPAISWLERQKNWNRPRVTVLTGLVTWAAGLVVVFSFNILKNFHPLEFIDYLSDKNIFSCLDFIVANIMLPINALLIALFAGWFMSWRLLADQLGFGPGISSQIWQTSLKYFCPAAILLIFMFQF